LTEEGGESKNIGVSRLPLLLALAACGLACGREQRAAPAAAETGRATTTFDVTRVLADPAALQAAVDRSPRALLPSFRLRGTSSVRVAQAGEPVAQLDEEALVERAPGGELHAFYGNSREQGRELFAAGGQVWVRPRYGKFHQRLPAEPDEAGRVADETAGTLAAYLELVLPSARLSDGGAVTAAGRQARKVVLARGAARPGGGDGWRGTIDVSALDGELVLDEATGAVLHGRLAARLSFTRESRTFDLTLTATHALEEVGGALVITPPSEAESSPTPRRSTEADDREELLGGLAPPARRTTPGAR
jgi:hypothetical protein